MRYEKFNRVAQAWAIVGVAALVRRDGDTIAEARVGLTNMGPTPLRAAAAEQALAGVSASNGGIAQAAELAADGTDADRRPVRAAGLPAAPGPGADPPGGDPGRERRTLTEPSAE